MENPMENPGGVYHRVYHRGFLSSRKAVERGFLPKKGKKERRIVRFMGLRWH